MVIGSVRESGPPPFARYASLKGRGEIYIDLKGKVLVVKVNSTSDHSTFNVSYLDDSFFFFRFFLLLLFLTNFVIQTERDIEAVGTSIALINYSS